MRERPSFWHEWRGSFDGRPSMLIRTLVSAFGCKIDLHKFIRPDDPGCFHTHPAYAIRIILWNGYIEELGNGALSALLPGTVSIVPPSLEHRLHALRNGGPSYSLWLRGPKIATVSVRGC